MANPILDRQIHYLQDEILLLGSMVEQAMQGAVDALQRRDIETARRIYRGDQVINEKRYAIENAIITLMAVQAPKARDLRLMAAFLEVITELERMGDYAKGVAKVTRLLEDGTISTGMREFAKMANHSVDMLHRALSAFIKQDAHAAYQIPPEDEQIDALYNKVYHDLVSLMIAEPSMIDQASLLMWVAHNLERMADRVTNICERTVFIATGELMEMDTETEESL
jgi:phosphate transport system protein